MNDPDRLSEVLGYRFNEPALLAQALTHSSVAQRRSERLDSNERLEFLGDRALGLVVAEWLFRRFPQEEEGDLARRFAALVRRESLAEVAGKLELGSYLILETIDEDATGRNNTGVLADACEALMGALYLDGGIEVVRQFVEKYWTAMLEAEIEPPQDAKTALQEWAQAKGLALPIYREVQRDGPPHDPVFTMEVSVGTLAPVRAKGTSKRIAEQLAAQALNEKIQKEND